METVYKLVCRDGLNLYSVFHFYYNLLNCKFSLCYGNEYSKPLVKPNFGAIFAFKDKESALNYLINAEIDSFEFFECEAELYKYSPELIPVLVSSKQKEECLEFWKKRKPLSDVVWTPPKGTVFCKSLRLICPLKII